MKIRYGIGSRGTLVLLAVVVLSMVSFSSADPRQWAADGLPIRQGTYVQWDRAAAQNADGYTLAAWSDMHSGERNVYAQLISPQGVLLWSAGGRAVSPFGALQEFPSVAAVSDGWIIAWIDYRNAGVESEIRVQKLDVSGNPVWTGHPEGIVLAPAPSYYGPLAGVTEDTQGGAFVTWMDAHNVFVQRVTSDGIVPWTTPVALMTEPANVTDPKVIGDGSGNVIVAWTRALNIGAYSILASKIARSGAMAWLPEVREIATSTTGLRYLALCADGSGGALLGWSFDIGLNTSIVMQRLSPQGDEQWTTGGVVLCDATGHRYDLHLALSTMIGSADGFLAGWSDARSEHSEAYCQKIGPDGQGLWTPNGVLMLPYSEPDHVAQGIAQVTSNNAGGMVCVWMDEPQSNRGALRASKLSTDGAFLWGAEGVSVINNGDNNYWPVMLAPNILGTMVLWIAVTDSASGIHAQSLHLGDGRKLLGPTGIGLVSGSVTDATSASCINMSPGRAAVVFQEFGALGGSWLKYQIVGPDGAFEKPVNGVRLIPEVSGVGSARQYSPVTCSDGASGFFTTYLDLTGDFNRIRIQHVNSAGEIVGSLAGVGVFDNDQDRDQTDARMAPDGDGGCYVAWTNYNASYLTDAYVSWINRDGLPGWESPLRLTNSDEDDIIQSLTPLSDGTGLVTWCSGSGEQIDIYAARIGSDGTVHWSEPVCSEPNRQSQPVTAPDGQGGAYFAWADFRNAASIGDIYAQHLTSTGVPEWGIGGLAVISDGDEHSSPALCVAPDGSVYVAWEVRTMSESDVYAQKLSPQGASLWGDHGVPLCTAAGDQTDVIIRSDQHSGLFAVWTDGRPGCRPCSYATHLNAQGQTAWDSYWNEENGNRLVGSPTDLQSANSVADDGLGGYFVTWKQTQYWDEAPVSQVYMQRIVDGAAPVTDRPVEGPVAFSLAQNYPNPFNPVTDISFALPRSGHVTLQVYDILGRNIATLMDDHAEAGNHTVTFDATNLSSGVYIYRLESASFRESRKMVVLK